MFLHKYRSMSVCLSVRLFISHIMSFSALLGMFLLNSRSLFIAVCSGDFDIKYSKDRCENCDDLRKCSTVDGSVKLKGGFNNPTNEKDLHFPKLTEITGHLLVSMLFEQTSLGNIFPNLAVIRGKVSSLLWDYSLIIYRNNRLQELGLNSLTTILNGGVRIEKNINLCYLNTVRWTSILRNGQKSGTTNKYSFVLANNNNECFDQCISGKCFPPAGHGSSGRPYCWGPGRRGNNECQQRK